MPFLIPTPTPASPAIPTKETAFTISSTDGTAEVSAVGLPATATIAEFRVSNSFMTSNGADRITSEISSGPSSAVMTFTVTGIFNGDKLALFQQKNFGTGATDLNWTKIGTENPVKVSADQFTELVRAGKLEKYVNNRLVEFDPFGSLERRPPLTEKDWVDSVKKALDEIWADPLGKSLVNLLSSPVVIRPWIPNSLGALSGQLSGIWYVDFSSQSCIDTQVASSPAEVLLHELIHVLENKKDGYLDLKGFIFDTSDFMTINVTNVFSAKKGRSLRKDHFRASLAAPPSLMPAAYVVDPAQHAQDLKDDYKIAKTKHPHIFKSAADAGGSWNPFLKFNSLKP